MADKAEQQAMESAQRALKAYTEKITELLMRERPADATDLLNPSQSPSALSHVRPTYFDFPTWLWRFDDELRNGLSVDINSYRWQRNQHIKDVNDILSYVVTKDTGKALGAAIDATKRNVFIFPYFNFSLYHRLPFLKMGLNAFGRPWGTNALINFSAHMWGRNGRPGTSGEVGPGSDADEVLFHEMVHTLRHLLGVASDKSEPVGDFDDEEEFVAIVVANIYAAEKGAMKLRGGHEGHPELQDPRNFWKKPLYQKLLRKFEAAQGKFFNALANIPEKKAWWNPIRDLSDAETD